MSVTAMKWNEEQRAFIEQPLTPGTMIGIPGGGKTRSIIGRILYHIGRETLSEDGFLILTFSRTACADFRHKGYSICEQEIFTDRNVRTIHSAAGSILMRTVSDIRVSSLETTVARAIQVLHESDVTLVRQLPFLKNVCSITVDEAQDISAVQYEFVKLLGEKLSASIVLVGDPNQSIYGFQGGDSKLLMQHPGWKVQLTKNYRSLPAIVRVANAARPVADVRMHSMRDGVENDKPCIVVGKLSQLDALKKRVLDIIEGERCANGLRNMAVVGPVRHSYSNNNKFYKIGLQWIANVLHENNIPFRIHYSEATGNHHDSSRRSYDGVANGTKFTPGVVHLLTIHAAKGLEFDSVIVLNFHENAQGIPLHRVCPDLLRQWKALWYVALTRAKNRLWCICLKHLQVFTFGKHDRATLERLIRENFSFRDADEHPKYLPDVRQGNTSRTASVLWNWTDVLSDRTLMSETALCELENNMLHGVEATEEAALTSPVSLPDWDSLACLYGVWAESYFEYCHTGVAECFTRIRHMVDNVIVLPVTMQRALSDYRKRFRFTDTVPISVRDLNAELLNTSGERATHALKRLIAHVQHAMARDERFRNTVHLHIENDSKWFNVQQLADMVKDWNARSDNLQPRDIWTMCFFIWQYESEAKYRWENRDEIVENATSELRMHASYIRDAAATLHGEWTFQVNCSWTGLPVAGVLDAVDKSAKQIIEFKFTPARLQTSHAIQVLGYAVMLEPNAAHEYKIVVWNLYRGQRHSIIGKWDEHHVNKVHGILSSVVNGAS